MVRYLEKGEYGKCRSLWEEAFPEDSKSFADYYFSEKLPGSKVLAIEGKEGKLLTMAHLNPYMISVNGKKWELPYIVGVATAADQRHKGYMRQVLYKMLQDLKQEKKPFCFLMPAADDDLFGGKLQQFFVISDQNFPVSADAKLYRLLDHIRRKHKMIGHLCKQVRFV